MYTTAITLVLFLWRRDLFVAGNANINTYVAENGLSYYKTPLYCTYTSLYMVNPYNNIRSTYVMTDDRNCCLRADIRGKCCVQTDSKGLYQSCKCDPTIACGTTTTVPTTTPECTTTVPTTSTETTTIVPTTTPETTTTVPTTSTETTAVPTTTTDTTTTAPTPLCRSPTFRVLYGEKASTDCPNSGVFNITFLDGERSICNGVYTVATVNGVFKPTILTSEVCKTFIESLAAADMRIDINIGSQIFAVVQPNFTVLSGPEGTAFIDVAESLRHILDQVGDCQRNVRCPYNKVTMQGRVNMTQCQIFSWGTSDSNDLSQNGLNQVAVTINSGGCQDIPDPASNNTWCFKSQSSQNVICSNDSGAPVYCKAHDTDEWILMGVTGLQTDCDQTPEFTVLPYPG